MARYLARVCPKCGDALKLVVYRPNWKTKELPVNGFCVGCAYKVNWKLLLGKNRRPGPSWRRKSFRLQH